MRTRRSARRAVRRLGLAAALAGAVALAPAAAQQELDLNQMALRFTQGAWAAPLVCEHDGKARRGLRRIRIDAATNGVIPPSNHMIVYPMRIPEGIRCYLDTGETQVDLAGSITFHLEGISRPDLAAREFSETLDREGGFTFLVKSGALDVGGKRVEFAGGKARFVLVRPGTDSYKRLADIEARHKLALTLSAPDGTSLVLDLALVGPGRQP